MQPGEDKSASRNLGAWYILIAAMLWGTTGTSQALAPPGAGSAAIGTARLVIGGLGLLTYALLRGRLRDRRRWPLAETCVAAASMAAYQVFFFSGVARTGVAVGTIVGIGSSPILAGVIGFLVRGERPGVRWAVATTLAIAGCSLLISSGGVLQIHIGGIFLAIGAGLAYAIFTVASKNLLENHAPEAVMAVTFCLGAVLLLPLIFSADLGWLRQARGVAVALHLGLVTVAVAYTFFARGLQQVSVASAATLTLAEPLTAAALGIFLLGERLTLPAFIGILLIFSGLALLSLRKPIKSTIQESESAPSGN
jgi:DME family drug/metabolite transporter